LNFISNFYGIGDDQMQIQNTGVTGEKNKEVSPQGRPWGETSLF